MTASAPPQIFSARRRAARAERAQRLASRPGAPRWLADALVDDAAERIAFLRVPPSRALLVGTGAHLLADQLASEGFTVSEAQGVDPEQPLAEGDFGLVVSLGVLDTINDLPGALLHLRAALAPQGVLIASFPGAGSLPHLRAALLAADGERPAARLHPAVDARSGAGLLQRAGFARQVADSWPLRIGYGALDTLVADLRAQGLGNVLADSPPPLTRAGLERARTAFLTDADSRGRVVETLEILTLTGWRH